MANDSKLAEIRTALPIWGRNVEVNYAPVILDSVIETAAIADIGSLYTMFRIPTLARINGLSQVMFDDLMTAAGAPTIDIGLKGVDGNLATPNDLVLNDGIAVAAAGTAPMIKDHANYGKKAWELLGLDKDPGGFFDVTIVVRDLATDTAGTITATICYSAY